MIGEVGLDPVQRLEFVILQRPAEQVGEAAPRQPHGGAPHRAEHGAECLVLQGLRPCRLDVVAQRFEQRADGLRRAGDFGVDRLAPRVVIKNADAQPPRVGAELVDVRTCRRWRDDRVADAGAERRVEQRGRVTNGAADAVLDRQAGLVADRTQRDATLARLEPDEPATRRRDADRTAAVTRVSERHHPRRDGGGRTAARTAGRSRGVPWIVGRTPRDGLGGRHAAELGAVRSPGDHQPGRAVAADERRVGVGDYVRFLECDVAVAEALPRVFGEQVLEENGTPRNGPLGSSALRRRRGHGRTTGSPRR